MEVKIDKYGLKFTDVLPDEFSLAKIDDFLSNGKLRMGMTYLVKWADRDDYYELRTVNERLTSKWLIPFIEDNRVFVKKQAA